jgi:protein SCO1/2
MMFRYFPTRSIAIAVLFLLASLGLALTNVVIAESTSHEHADHSSHAHSGHADHGAAGAEDPHAHHRAMMESSAYRRSEHDYPLQAWGLTGMDGKDTDLLQALDCDSPVMVNFIFTTCTTICPVMSATFSQVQSELGPAVEDVCMVSFSIDPEYDVPARLREYAQRFNAGPQWQFYTGSLQEIIAIQRAFDVYRGNKMNHEPTTLMRATPNTPWVRIDGIASAKDIIKEYQRLLKH